jgi:anti-sigma-K factor RskA
MDKLAEQLRADAARIESAISPELDARIRASLEGITPEPVTQRPSKWESKSFSSWWISSLTGVAAALVLIIVVNLQAPDPAPVLSNSTPQPLILPAIEWHARTAVLTSPLEQEIENLQSDLKKAEEAVRQDIDRLF